ncbi:putative lipid-binding transport protein (Tim44 family) [Rhizomicrobium palustre]|uniref:Putative lipid-binding transport protein (Tim44 family) n=1 Tax=Rhizomicrobium palustre TaxID=189966 RepID=A0A846MY11_9PROT|nr:hypothetical protein [Rhizomicrobium palustre]NIK88276.1 putative lipid-binding transport protein (Tim44 family) [Rhizomicrobium palustre]
MLRRIAAVAFVACGLAGCTDADWDHAFSYAGMGSDSAAPVTPASTAAPASPATATPAASAPAAAMASAPDDRCQISANAAALEVKELGFDEKTQKNRADQALKQCQTAR